MNYDEAQQILENMGNLEAMALIRCASYQMDQEDWEEIGSSDISCRAVGFIQHGLWPTDFKGIGVGFIVDEYDQDVQKDPESSPLGTLHRVIAEGSYKNALPDWAYEGKHVLSIESEKMFSGMQKLFHG